MTPTAKKAAPRPKPTGGYRVCERDADGREITGLNYPPGRTATPGDVVTDLPDGSVAWLLKQGYVEAAEED